MEERAELIEIIRRELEQPVPAGAVALAERAREIHGESVQAVLFYGSNLRRGDDAEGILDLYVLVDDYRRCYSRRLLALSNRVLPPNVFYLEAATSGRTVRAKYAVVSLVDFERYNRRRVLQSYFWGRFAQPCALLYARSPTAASVVRRALAEAVLTMIERAVPLLAERFTVAELWKVALTASYRTELRSEREGTPSRLYEGEPQRFERVTRAALPALSFPASIGPGDGTAWIEVQVSARSRRLAPHVWRLRRVQGKLLSILRLLKGAVTFDGGVDYVLWKIERHSGMKVDPEALRGRNRLFALGAAFWRLYRDRAFR